MLPKIEYPTFDVVDPITKQKIKMRPMLVKEEKILLIAKQADSKQDQINAVKQIIQNCSLDKDFDVETIPFCSMEWLFLKLRAQSIGNVVTVQYQQEEDKQVEYKVDLDKVEVKQPQVKGSNTVKINDTISMSLKQPTVKTYSNDKLVDFDQEQLLNYMLINSMDKIFEGDSTHDTSTTNEKELQDFVDSIPASCYKKIQEFFDNAPSLYYSLDVVDNEGKDQKLELTTLDDFFIFV